MERGTGPGAEAAALAAAWSLAAAALREPEDGLGATLADGGPLGKAGREVGGLDGGGPGGLEAVWERYRAAVLRAGPAEMAGERARILGHAVRGPCPPYEIEYGSEHFLGKSRRLGDVAAFYRAFGVEVADGAREREDHAAVEAEFLSLLCAKRALAAGRGEAEREGICRDAERLFLEEHLGRFLPSFARRVAEREPGSALAVAARLAAATARVHASLVGARLGAADLELVEPGTLEEEAAISCSTCAVPGAGGGPPESSEV
jgi:hypothetical protein